MNYISITFSLISLVIALLALFYSYQTKRPYLQISSEGTPDTESALGLNFKNVGKTPLWLKFGANSDIEQSGGQIHDNYYLNPDADKRITFKIKNKVDKENLKEGNKLNAKFTYEWAGYKFKCLKWLLPYKFKVIASFTNKKSGSWHQMHIESAD